MQTVCVRGGGGRDKVQTDRRSLKKEPVPSVIVPVYTMGLAKKGTAGLSRQKLDWSRGDGGGGGGQLTKTHVTLSSTQKHLAQGNIDEQCGGCSIARFHHPGCTGLCE
jgi:hypothetical protein